MLSMLRWRLASAMAVSISRSFCALPIVDPGAERDVQSEFGGELRHPIEAVADAIGADRARIRRDHGKVGSDLRLGGDVGLAIVSCG